MTNEPKEGDEITLHKGWNNITIAIWMEICFQLTCEANDDNFNMYDRELFHDFTAPEIEGDKPARIYWRSRGPQLKLPLQHYNRIVPNVDNNWKFADNDNARLEWCLSVKFYKSDELIAQEKQALADSVIKDGNIQNKSMIRTIKTVNRISPLLKDI